MIFAAILIIVPVALSALLAWSLRHGRAARWVVLINLTRRRSPTLYWTHIICLAGAVAVAWTISGTLLSAAIVAALKR